MIWVEADDLLALLHALAERDGLAARFDERAVAAAWEAFEEAEQRAAGQSHDEPCALFLSLSRRSLAFHPVARRFIETLVHAQATGIGYELNINHTEFAVLSARIALGGIDFLELRGWFAARLRAFGAKREPPVRRRLPRPK
ncbi:MAG: hypothetical protein IPK82_08620 [Polyangiaceae bacterium]|nr:hypothetical protein [Polyangiaceae bacterium]